MNLARASLLVEEEYPQLSVDLYLARLDQLAEEVKDQLADETAPLVVLDALIDTLYVRRKLSGNQKAYYDPRNCFLNDLLDRGLGIPLTLGIVMLEVGWRLGLPLEGVSFPGLFLVRYTGDAVDLLLDPFDGGKVHFQDEAQELLDGVYGGGVPLKDSFLRKARPSRHAREPAHPPEGRLRKRWRSRTGPRGGRADSGSDSHGSGREPLPQRAARAYGPPRRVPRAALGIPALTPRDHLEGL